MSAGKRGVPGWYWNGTDEHPPTEVALAAEKVERWLAGEGGTYFTILRPADRDTLQDDDEREDRMREEMERARLDPDAQWEAEREQEGDGWR